MLSRGKLRAEHYSMLGKTYRTYSNRSVLSSDTAVRDKLVSNKKMAPINANLARFSQKSQKTRHRGELVSQSMQVSTNNSNNFNFQTHMKNISRPMKTNNSVSDENAYDEANSPQNFERNSGAMSGSQHQD